MTIRLSNMHATFSNSSYRYTGIGFNANLVGAAANSTLLELKTSDDMMFVVYTNGDAVLTGNLYINGTIFGNGISNGGGGGTGTVTQVNTGNGISGGPITGTGTLQLIPNTGVVVNTSGIFVNSAYIGTLTSNNATYAFGKSESDLNVNSAATATSASQLGGKTESNLNVNSASTATSASTLNGKTEGNLNVNSASTATSASQLGGKTESNLNVNSALFANFASYVLGNTGIVSNATGVFVNSAYIATIDANNASYLGGTAASGYQTTAGLASNVATLSANYATYILANNGIVSNSTGVFVKGNTGLVVNSTGVFVNATYIATLDANNAAYLGGTAAASYVQNTDTRTLSGNLIFSGANVNFTGLLDIIGSLRANGSVGSSGQVLASNGSAPYWVTVSGTGTVTQVNTGNGLTGGPVTTTGTISVLANNGIIANSTGVFVNANTGLVANSTGLHSVAVANIQTFNSSGTWTKPSSGTMAIIECIGGGGSGGANRGGGGGGGSYVLVIKPLSSLSSTETVTVGLGGVASNTSNNGTSGGTTTFGSHVTAYGGCGGAGNTTVTKTGGHGGSPFGAPGTPGVTNSTSSCVYPPGPNWFSIGTYQFASGTTITSGCSTWGVVFQDTYEAVYGMASPRNLSSNTSKSFVEPGIGGNGFGGGGGGGFSSNTSSSYVPSNTIFQSNTDVDIGASNPSVYFRTRGLVPIIATTANTTMIMMGGSTTYNGGAGGGGGGGSTTSTTLAAGGTSGNYRCANGGAGGNNTVVASAGSFPGGGGGGGGNTTSFFVSGAGANGQCIVTVI